MQEDMSVGERIRYYRKRRGLSQPVLAGLVGRSTSWLRKVERGERAVDKLSVLRLLANVLKVGVADLVGAVELPPNGGAPFEEPRGVHALSRAVMALYLPDREPAAPGELRASVERALRERFVYGRPESLVRCLPELVVASRVAVAQDVAGAWWCLAGAYRVGASLAGIFGDTKLSWVCAREGVAAAQRSGDALLVASAQRRLAFSYLQLGWFDEAAAVCSDATDAIAPTAATSLAGWSLWGCLQLTGAVAAARAEDRASSRRLLVDARTAAERVGEGHDYYWEAFEPASVGAHAVTVALEHGDPVEAVRLADSVQVDHLQSPERRATFSVEVAYAHGLRRDDGAAVAVLVEAERYAPEMVRYSVMARELVRVCMGRERRSRTPHLRGLAERMGVIV
jgi:transcriptional regulator with XRE-family HTH domain